MKIKYIDKRHWRRLLERDYIEGDGSRPEYNCC